MSEQRVYLVQCLCPQRHCALAVALEGTEDDTPALLDKGTETIEAAFKSGAFNRKCGICDSKELTFELGRTPYKTMEEARGPLAEEQDRQLVNRMLSILEKAKRN